MKKAIALLLLFGVGFCALSQSTGITKVDRSDTPLSYWQATAGICPEILLGPNVSADESILPPDGDTFDDGFVSINFAEGIIVLYLPKISQTSSALLNIFVDVSADGNFDFCGDWIVRNLPVGQIPKTPEFYALIKFTPVKVILPTWIRIMIGYPEIKPECSCCCCCPLMISLTCGEIEDYFIKTEVVYLTPICPTCPGFQPQPPAPKPPCNQGVGNGPEGCDPGRSSFKRGSNDEDPGTGPGNPGHKPDDEEDEKPPKGKKR